MPSTRHPVSLPKLATRLSPIEVDPHTLVRHEPQWKRDLVVRGLLVIAGVLLLQPILIAAGILLLTPLAIRYHRLSTLMKEGDTIPAKLISVSPPLVAAYGDLCRGISTPSPVLVVFPIPAESLLNAIQRGDRLAVIARGLGGDQERYGALEVRLIATVTDNAAILQRAIESVPDWDWESLDEVLFDLNRTPEAGVYAVN